MLARHVSPTVKIISLDILPLKPLNNVKIFNLDFTLQQSKSVLMEELKKDESSPKLIVSDMCVNLTGTQFLDISRNLELWNDVLQFSIKVLQPNGNLVLKIFESPESNRFVSESKHFFRDVVIFKPKASRAQSSEKYLICLNKK